MQRYYVFITGLIIFSLAAVGVGMTISRGPVADQKRVSDMSVISEGVMLWAVSHRALPASLDEVSMRPLQGRLSDYTYQVTGMAQYQLCTTFATERSVRGGFTEDTPNVYDHHKGYQCFTYRVPELKVPVVTPMYHPSPSPKPVPAT